MDGYGRDSYMVFIDLEKAYGRVPRGIIWWIFENKGVSSRYIDVIMDITIEQLFRWEQWEVRHFL